MTSQYNPVGTLARQDIPALAAKCSDRITSMAMGRKVAVTIDERGRVFCGDVDEADPDELVGVYCYAGNKLGLGALIERDITAHLGERRAA